MNVYVASSWRNPHQPAVVEAVRRAGHQVYDFRNPAPGEVGFSWAQVDPDWQEWSPEQFKAGLRHSTAVLAFGRDQRALDWCDACLLVLPCGMSAHLEAGWCAGRGKPVVVYAPEVREAELMYKLFDQDDASPICTALGETIAVLETIQNAKSNACP